MLVNNSNKSDEEQFLENLKRRYAEDKYLSQEEIDEIIQKYYGLK